MNSKEIIEAFSYVAKEKNVEKSYLTNIIEEIFTSMLLKKYGEEYEPNFSTIVNMERGEIEIFHEKEVVGVVKNEITEISISEAIKTDSTLVIGDMYIDIVNPDIFGRRLIAHAKQHLSQKIKDIEKESIYSKFNNKINTIYSGYVHQIQRDRIFVTDNDKIEIILPKSDQIYNDHFRRGEQIRGLIKSVDFYPGRSPEIIMSRTTDIFLERLFELEVPEIEDGIIEIKKIARSAGNRSKIVVHSSDRRIDAVGACVGMKGSRIQSIVRELNGENIDIINWSDQPEILISRSLSPAKPKDLYIDNDKQYALAIFEEDEINKAIGKDGVNIKLSNDVSGYKIDVMKSSDYVKSKDIKIDDLKSINNKQKKLLIENSIKNTKTFFNYGKDDLLKLKGMGPITLDTIHENITNEIMNF